MSFGESVFSAEFIQKTVKVDLFVKANHVYPQPKLLGKDLEHTRRQSTKADLEWLTCGADRHHLQAGWPVGPAGQSPLRRWFFHHYLGSIYAVTRCRFK